MEKHGNHLGVCHGHSVSLGLGTRSRPLTAEDSQYYAPAPRQHKPFKTLGGVQAFGQRYRAWMNVYPKREWGPTRATEPEAKADMALMRAAATREAVGTVAGRLRAEADAQHAGL